MNPLRECIVPLLVLLAGGSGRMTFGQAGAELSEQQSGAVDAAIRQRMEQESAVGLAVAVIRRGEVAYSQAYGFEDRGRRIEASSDTMFRWASVSKPLTAIAAMQLVQAGKLDLDVDIRQYVPEFPERHGVITTRQLLCHQSGIVHYENGRVIRRRRRYRTPHPFEDVVVAIDTFCESPLVHQPGTKVAYSSHAYILLSAVVQRAGDARFVDQVASRISGPLKMTTLQPDYQWQPIPHRAVGYRKIGRRIGESIDKDVSWKLGGGGFISTIDDLAKFAAGLVRGDLVAQESRTQMWTPQKTKDGSETNWGLGFTVSRQNGQLKVEHNGRQEKARVRMVLYPDAGHGVVVMSNCEFIEPSVYTTLTYKALSSTGR